MRWGLSWVTGPLLRRRDRPRCVDLEARHQVSAHLQLRLAAGEPVEFLPKISALAQALPTMRWPTALVAGLSLAIILLWPKRWSRVPGSIVAVIVGTGLVAIFRLPVETIGGKYGGIPQGWPEFHFPRIELAHLDGLIRPAFTIALLGAIESLLSAVVADGLVDDRHDSNQELMAQGVANFAVPFFGGIPVTGVIARTATNVRNGAGSPVGVRRTILPRWLARFCAWSRWVKWSPVVRNRLPSGVCAMRQPQWLPRDGGPCWRKITRTSSRRGSPSWMSRARASAVSPPPSTGAAKQK